MSSILQFRLFDQQGIESLQGGNSWVELTRTFISRTISPDLTDVDSLATAYCLFLEKGPSSEIMNDAPIILQLWGTGVIHFIA